jgi:hypothetical protein
VLDAASHAGREREVVPSILSIVFGRGMFGGAIFDCQLERLALYRVLARTCAENTSGQTQQSSHRYPHDADVCWTYFALLLRAVQKSVSARAGRVRAPSRHTRTFVENTRATTIDTT